MHVIKIFIKRFYLNLTGSKSVKIFIFDITVFLKLYLKKVY